MKKIITIASLVLFNLTIAFCQVENVPLTIGLGGGVDIISNKDIAASPLTYKGFGLPVGINGFKLSNKWINHFEIAFILPVLTNNYSLKSNVDTRLLNWSKVNFRYQLLRQFSGSKDNYIGGEIKSNFFYREYDFLDGFGWEFQNNLSITYARKISLNKKSFLLPQVSLPVFGYINRKSSLTYDESFLEDFNNGGAISLLNYGEWKFQFDDWVSIEFDLLYYINLSERFNLQFKLGLNYYSIKFPEKVRNINLPIRCYINYQF